MTQADEERICIVGAGQAGGELAIALRQQGCAAPIVVIGEEVHAPYQRPPLSKACLKGHVDTSSLQLKQRASYERSKVELVLDTRVEGVDARARSITLSSGRELKYAKLALTTGARVRKLTGQDAQQAERTNNFHYLRTIDDAQKIRSCLDAGQRLVIIGGGFIGLEVAASAATCGVNVTVLEALPRVLARVTAPEMSAFYESVHREAGVNVRTGVVVTGFEFSAGGDAVTGVQCSDGALVPADAVVIGIGVVPNTELAQAAGLVIDNGIVVDEYARTSDPHIVAAGDCTNHPNLLSGRRVRLESVPNAVEQARTAAATLIGNERPYHAVPWFWSDQHDLKLQIAGLSEGYDEIVLRGSMSSRSFTLFYLRARQLIASDAVNRPQEFMVAKRLVAGRVVVDPALLMDESVPLKTLVPAAGGS